MTSLQASGLLFSSSSLKRMNIANVPKLLTRISFSVLHVSTRKLVQESKASTNTIPLEENVNTTTQIDHDFYNLHKSNMATALQLFAILEAVSDRIEMHHNVGEQRDNWNALLLNSINMITLAATTMAGVATSIDFISPLFSLKLSSTLLFSAATGMLLVMNKIQPSQLAEKQRIATRLFRQLHTQIQTTIALGNTTEEDVKSAIEKVLALDKAYPLPLLGGAMLEKFPSKFQPAIWWPSSHRKNKLNFDSVTLESSSKLKNSSSNFSERQINPKKMEERKNGWSEELELEMREIIEVIKRKDMEDYERLGNMALKINRILAISGPLLTGIAALGSAIFVGDNNNGSWGTIVPFVAGALASAINAFEHGGQVGMVLEMYRNCGGFFKLLEETVEATLEEKNYERRENGEMFEMKMALQLGRSVSQLRELASKSAFCRTEGTESDEFASKLF